MLYWLCIQTANAQFPTYLQHGHAHNDYDKPWPALHTALHKGFRSIEVDVYPYKGKLKVAHWPFALNKAADLETLYIQPLDSLQQAQSPWLSDTSPLILMIDIKRQGIIAQQLLEHLCQKYPSLFCHFDNNNKQLAPVQLLLSGQYDWEGCQQQSPHYWQIDGRWSHLDASPQLVPRISQPYTASFSWKGQGAMPPKQQRLLKGLVERAHKAGKKLRFWGVPNKTAIWKVLSEAGVDWIQVDDLEAYEFFLKNSF
ncbi:MAG: hypothetical protein AB8E82_15725 [Aureispira sp.]